MSIKKQLENIRLGLPLGVKLIVVSKTHSNEAIMEAYDSGERLFGESRVQELVPKYEQLPKDIEWHMIGTVQRNKVKYIAPFVSMIHSVDSLRLLDQIEKEAAKNERVIDTLLEVFIADEESKHGWERDELMEMIETGGFKRFKNVRIRGLMGMATFTEDTAQIKGEFQTLKQLFDSVKINFDDSFDTLSMGMTSDYQVAIDSGSNMVRIGSLIFGTRSPARQAHVST